MRNKPATLFKQLLYLCSKICFVTLLFILVLQQLGYVTITTEATTTNTYRVLYITKEIFECQGVTCEYQ